MRHMIEGFLLGVISTASLAAGVFFWKFWRDTRDSFSLLFAASFIVQALNRAVLLLLPRPNEGLPSIYLVRLSSFILILVAILRKNYGSKN